LKSRCDRDTPPRQTGGFWAQTPLSRLSRTQWEALCDRCGRCCLEKLADPKTGKIYYTSVACRLFDPLRCECRQYAQRTRLVKSCLTLTPDGVRALRWLPRTCAYRLLTEGQPLPWWHPLVSGDAATVHTAGISLRSRRFQLTPQAGARLEDYIVDWGIWGRRACGSR
jgi:uncharacterized cysteine cluster protein YcgN (CxxCxxCC family)